MPSKAQRFNSAPYKNIAIAGNESGIKQLAQTIPAESIRCIISPVIRPHLLPAHKKLAKLYGCELIIQPRFKSPDYPSFLRNLRRLQIDLLVCNNYAMIIRPDVLDYLRHEAINIHWALLPKNRGANPVQWSLIRDEKRTGITFHYMNDGIDCGDIIAQDYLEISDSDTWVTLKNKLEIFSGAFVPPILSAFLEGRTSRYQQDETQATTNHCLNPNSPQIDFEKMSNRQIYNLIRAQVAPLGGAYIQTKDSRIYFPEIISMENVEELRRRYGKTSISSSGYKISK